MHSSRYTTTSLLLHIVLSSHTPHPQTVADQLHGSQELEKIWTVLQQVSVTADDGEQWLTYPAFLQVGPRAYVVYKTMRLTQRQQATRQCCTLIGDSIDHILCPSAFLRLQRDDQCRVCVRVMFQYLIQRATLLNLVRHGHAMHHIRIICSILVQRFQLARFDEDGDGYLTPEQLLAYIADTASQITQITQFSAQLSLADYCDLALRKLLFWHRHAGRCVVGLTVNCARGASKAQFDGQTCSHGATAGLR